MGLSITTGVFSGLDTGQLIEQLMAVERQPIQSLAVKKSGYQAKISAFGTLKSTLTSLKSAISGLETSSTQAMSTSVSDVTKFTASATSSATAGSYNIQINTMAVAQSIYSATFATANSEVADLSTYATQKLKLQVGTGTAKEITITSSNNSLTGIRDAINDAGAGVKASVVNAGFEIGATNNGIVFSDGSSRTATLTAGTYSADELAAEIKRAMEAANGGSDTYTVSYDTASNKFTIVNDATNANAVDILWENASSTAATTIGFTAADHASVAVGSSAIGDSAVGGQRLVLTSETTGAANRIKILVDEDNDGTYAEATSETDTTGLSRLAFDPTYDAAGAVDSGTANMTQSKAGVSAALVVDGLSISRSTNSIDDVIDGVTLTLLETTASTETLTVAKDTTNVVNKVNAFVSAYNSAMSLARSLSTSADGKASLLTGDSTARTVTDTLRSSITTTFGSYKPATLGLSHSKEGVLTLDTSVLENFINKDLDGVITSFNALAEALEDDVSYLVNTAIPTRTGGLNDSIERANGKIADLERRLEQKELQLIKRFTLLEQTIGEIQSSGDFLSKQLQSIADIGKKE